jgi:hypothetical protein
VLRMVPGAFYQLTFRTQPELPIPSLGATVLFPKVVSTRADLILCDVLAAIGKLFQRLDQFIPQLGQSLPSGRIACQHRQASCLFESPFELATITAHGARLPSLYDERAQETFNWN